MTRIEELQSFSPEKRYKSLADRYDKNLIFFQENHPDIYRGLTTYPFPFEVVVTENFIDIVDLRTNTSCFPDVSLEKLAKSLGGVTHQAWTDLLDLKLKKFPLEHQHGKIVHHFNQRLFAAFPQFSERFLQFNVFLADGINEKKYSNPTVFIGLFHGLHIDEYLNRANVRSAVFIEPELERFQTSCYFLDYESLDREFDGLLIHVGPQPPNQFFRNFFKKSFITSNVWLRVLFGYPSQENGTILHALQTRWRGLGDQWFPADLRLQSYKNVLANLKNKRRLLASTPKLSNESRIAIVGAGPSLNQELSWLKKNASKLIIFSAHSAIRPLAGAGIIPDLQFCLDIHLTVTNHKLHQFHKSTPVVLEIKTNQPFIDEFDLPFLVADASEDYPVKFKLTLKNTQPTTGNLCVALAAHFAPKVIYLVGLDFAFRDVAKSHASGGVYDTEGMQRHGAGRIQIPVTPNFAGEGDLLSRPYFDEARIRVEDLIATIQQETTIYNLSDGARIIGAIPRRSKESFPSRYAQRQSDLDIILHSFTPADPDLHCQDFTDSLELVLRRFSTALKEEFSTDIFTWERFSAALDDVLVKATMLEHDRDRADNRLRPFNDITQDLLISWFKFMIFSKDQEEAQYLYTLGKTMLFEATENFVSM